MTNFIIVIMAMSQLAQAIQKERNVLESIKETLNSPFYLRKSSNKQQSRNRAGTRYSSPCILYNKSIHNKSILLGLAPNLFGFQDQTAETVKTCRRAFQLFYKQSFSNMRPKPFHLVRRLPGVNESEAKQWSFFFNPGLEGAEGYESCYKENSLDTSRKFNY